MTFSKDLQVPELLTMLSREEIGELFGIYFDHSKLRISQIDQADVDLSRYTCPNPLSRVPHPRFSPAAFPIPLHSVSQLRSMYSSSQTRICAIASRYYSKRPELRTHLSAYAKRLAFEVPSRGYKSVEVVQAYLLLSLWTLGPEKTFEQDRTWLMLGMAIRCARP
jgi:hypothetical protein